MRRGGRRTPFCLCKVEEWRRGGGGVKGWRSRWEEWSGRVVEQESDMIRLRFLKVHLR